MDVQTDSAIMSFKSFMQESCPAFKNILLLDSEGKRVAVNYYSDDWPTNAAKEAFEKAVFAKTQKTNARTEAEITMFDNYIVIYKFAQDLHFFVTGSDNENEIILASVLQGFFDAVGILLRGNVEKEALENLDLILLCLDEIVDGGVRGVGCFGLLTSYVKTQTRPNKCKPNLMNLKGFISKIREQKGQHTHI